MDRAAAVNDMEAFLDAGITTFDCADIYVGVEQMIGEDPVQRPTADQVSRQLLRLEIETLGQHLGPDVSRKAA